MFLEPERHFALADRGDDPLLGGAPTEKLQRPPHAPLGRFAAGQSDYLLPLASRKRGRGPAPRRVVQCAFQTQRTASLPDAADHPLRAADVFDNLLVGEPFVGLQQHQRSPNHAHRSRPSLHQLLQLLSRLVREAYNMLLHAGAYSTGVDFKEDVLGGVSYLNPAGGWRYTYDGTFNPGVADGPAGTPTDRLVGDFGPAGYGDHEEAGALHGTWIHE